LRIFNRQVEQHFGFVEVTRGHTRIIIYQLLDASHVGQRSRDVIDSDKAANIAKLPELLAQRRSFGEPAGPRFARFSRRLPIPTRLEFLTPYTETVFTIREQKKLSRSRARRGLRSALWSKVEGERCEPTPDHASGV